MSNYSAATKAFQIPDILKNILSCLSVEEFVDVQATDPQFLAVAMLFPNLRYQFYLEEDPALQKDPNALPQINPVFAKAVTAGGWHFDMAACNRVSEREITSIRCDKMRSDSEREEHPKLLEIPPQMILFQPAPKNRIYYLHDSVPFGRRKWHDKPGNKFKVAYPRGTGFSLQKNIDAVLSAEVIPKVHRDVPREELGPACPDHMR